MGKLVKYLYTYVCNLSTLWWDSLTITNSLGTQMSALAANCASGTASGLQLRTVDFNCIRSLRCIVHYTFVHNIHLHVWAFIRGNVNRGGILTTSAEPTSHAVRQRL